MHMVTLHNWDTGKEDTFDFEKLTDDDAAMYVPRGGSYVARLAAQALYEMKRKDAPTPQEALIETLAAIVQSDNH